MHDRLVDEVAQLNRQKKHLLSRVVSDGVLAEKDKEIERLRNLPPGMLSPPQGIAVVDANQYAAMEAENSDAVAKLKAVEAERDRWKKRAEEWRDKIDQIYHMAVEGRDRCHRERTTTKEEPTDD